MGLVPGVPIAHGASTRGAGSSKGRGKRGCGGVRARVGCIWSAGGVTNPFLTGAKAGGSRLVGWFHICRSPSPHV